MNADDIESGPPHWLSDNKHRAFEGGAWAARQGLGIEKNPYVTAEYAEAWELGYRAEFSLVREESRNSLGGLNADAGTEGDDGD